MKTTEMWGVRFGYMLLLLGCKTEDEAVSVMQPLADDLHEYNAVVMEAEDRLKPYCYLMFHSQADAKSFYEKHKNEKLYKKAKIRLIKEPAYVPTEWLECSQKPIAEA